jgi:molybdate transport system ATP-binding protein
MAPLIRLENVTVSLDGTTILRGLCWRLRSGEHWAILGLNGSGKSTFLRLIRGELAPAPGNSGRRVYALNGEEQETAIGIKNQIACVSPELQQRYLQQDWRLTGLQAVQSGFGGGDYVYQKLTPKQEQAAQATMQLLGIASLARRNIQELSTGELRRMLVARALISSPRVLICDEICDGLDVRARTALLQTLNHVACNGTQLLYTTHRSEELPRALTHRLVFKAGRICEQGPLCGLGPQPSQPAQPPLVDRSIPARSTKGQTRAEAALPPADGRVLINIEHANVFLNQRPVLFDIHWTLRAGQHWAILGPNGAGKTTLLKLICGDVHPALGGRVRRFAFTPRNSLWEVKRRIGTVSPDLQANYRESLNGEAVAASGFFSSIGLRQRVNRRQRARVVELLGALGLSALSQKPVTRMSYGEFRKILLARAMVHHPSILVLDEPFDGLDVTAKAEMTKLLDAVAAAGTSLIVASHHASELAACTTHVAHLASGRIVEQGPVDALALPFSGFSNPEPAQTSRC